MRTAAFHGQCASLRGGEILCVPCFLPRGASEIRPLNPPGLNPVGTAEFLTLRGSLKKAAFSDRASVSRGSRADN